MSVNSSLQPRPAFLLLALDFVILAADTLDSYGIGPGLTSALNLQGDILGLTSTVDIMSVASAQIKLELDLLAFTNRGQQPLLPKGRRTA